MAELLVASLRVLVWRFGSYRFVDEEGGRRAKSEGSTTDVLFSRISCSLHFVHLSICFGLNGWSEDLRRGMKLMEEDSRLGREVDDDVRGPCCNLFFTRGLFCKTKMYCAHSESTD